MKGIYQIMVLKNIRKYYSKDIIQYDLSAAGTGINGFHGCHKTNDYQIYKISSSYMSRIGEIMLRIEQGCRTGLIYVST
jgi:hypothetical protein